MAAPAQRSEPSVSINPFSCSDQESPEDYLGFKPYSEALADFLLHPDTKGPLTISVEGEWGSGKTSFMSQLAAELKRRDDRPALAAGGNPASRVKTIWFSPWRHENEESLWAAFAVHFAQEIRKGNPWRRFRGDVRLRLKRLRWDHHRLELFKVLIDWLLIAVLGVATIRYGLNNGFIPILNLLTGDLSTGIPEKLTAGGGLLLAVVLAARKLLNLQGGPLSHDLKRFLDAPNYQERISFIERFHADFERVVKSYAGERRVVVFIDDLDRCEVPKAADLMKAINQLTSTSAQIFFVIGMDREKVAAGLAEKFKDLLPYLTIEEGSHPKGESEGMEIGKARRGMRFGYTYIEKFVQVPFHLPRPGAGGIGEYLEQLAKTPAEREAEARSRGTGDMRDHADEKRVAEASLRLGNDSAELLEIAVSLAPHLDHNPRRVKQFINLLRVRGLIAARTGLLDTAGSDISTKPLTIEQLAKFIVISMKFPLFIIDLSAHPRLLLLLQDDPDIPSGSEKEFDNAVLANEGISRAIIENWSGNRSLISLINHGLVGKHGRSEPDLRESWGFKHVNMERLFIIAPLSHSLGAVVSDDSRDDVSTEPETEQPDSADKAAKGGARKKRTVKKSAPKREKSEMGDLTDSSSSEMEQSVSGQYAAFSSEEEASEEPVDM
ncbi:MAG: hypothetical protein GY835_14240 [bacterium]|nr:hypothetical protein [bacterium]